MFKDFEDFKKNISWFVKPKDRITINESTVQLTNDFNNTFPTLSKLIKAARVLDISINDKIYKLYSWTSIGNQSCGWLCKPEPASISPLVLLPEHQLLLDNIGGISESYDQPEGAFTENQNFLFIKSECYKGLGYGEEYYQQICEDEHIIPVDYNNLLCFVDEANGGQTLYDLTTKQIYLFSQDHSFDYVTFLEGQPHYTFHLINQINTFVEYVEELARQWAVYVGLI